MQTGQQCIPQIYFLHGHAVKQVADLVQVEDAEDHCALDGRGQVLLSIGGWMQGPKSPGSSGPSRIKAEEAYTDFRGQHRVH